MGIIIDRLRKLYRLFPPLLSRDVKERYAGSTLGLFWTFLQPLLFVLLYWLIFSQIMKIRIHADTGEIPFLPFLLSGLLPWFAVQDGVLRGASSIIDKRHIIKKVMFPAELFPLSSVISSLVHHGAGIILFLSGFFLWKGDVSILQLFAIGVLLSVQILFTCGLSLLFSSLSVYLRDLTYILNVAFQVIFYTSTILYPITAVPQRLRILILLNPVTTLTEAYHDVILFNKSPGIGQSIYLTGITATVFLSGVYVFRKLKRGFADVL